MRIKRNVIFYRFIIFNENFIDLSDSDINIIYRCTMDSISKHEWTHGIINGAFGITSYICFYPYIIIPNEFVPLGSTFQFFRSNLKFKKMRSMFANIVHLFFEIMDIFKDKEIRTDLEEFIWYIKHVVSNYFLMNLALLRSNVLMMEIKDFKEHKKTTHSRIICRIEELKKNGEEDLK